MLNPESTLKTELIDPEIASIKRLSSDLSNFGYVRPEVWKRVIDEEQSVIAEGLNGFVHIPFEFNFDGHTLRAFDGEDFMAIATNGVEYAKNQTAKDMRYQFLLERAIYNYEESCEAIALARGDLDAKTIITIEPYPEEQERLYGAEFVQSLGFQPSKKLAIVRAIEKVDDGIVMYTRGVQHSDLTVWHKVLGSSYSGATTTQLVGHRLKSRAAAIDALDNLQGVYDMHIGSKDMNRRDVWQFLLNQTDLSNYFFSEIEQLSQTCNLTNEEIKQKVNRLRYNYWSALKLRFEGDCDNQFEIANHSPADIMQNAGRVMELRRETFAACGISINPVSEMTTAGMVSEIFSKDILKCVKCPFCKKTVDARINERAATIECLSRSCRAKLNTKTGERIDKRKSKTWHEEIGELLVSLFTGDKSKQSKQKQLIKK